MGQTDARRRGWLVLAVLTATGAWVLAGPLEEPDASSNAAGPAAEKEVAAAAPDAQGVIIPIDTDISDVTTESIKRRVERARDQGASVIIFEMNTPGGMVTSALDICDYIKGLTDLKTVAWVHTQAYSAGALISVSCNEIVMSSASTLGDCGVILGLPTGPQEVPEGIRAKAEAPVLSQFRDAAARRGYNRLLCEAMVIKEREVWWIENVETGERRFVDTQDKEKLVGADEDVARTQPADQTSDRRGGLWRLVESYEDPIAQGPVSIDQPVVRADALLTMSQSEAYAFGFAKDIADGEHDLRERYHLVGELPTVTFTWVERMVGWMTSMPVRGFLLLIVLLGAYVEFNTPGVGVPGLVALIALALFVGAPYMTGLANVWEILVIVIGIVLLGVEIFVLPGFGVAGVTGILCILVGLLATFVPEEPGRRFPIYWPSMEQGLEGLKFGVLTLASAIGGSFLGAVLLSKYLPHIPLLKLAAPENPQPSRVTLADPYGGAARVGDIGLAESPLRPAGRARFGATLVDVVTEGEWLDTGTEVEVIEHRGNHVVVRKV